MGVGRVGITAGRSGEIHFRLRLFPFFSQKGALIAKQSRCTVLQSLVVVKVELTSIFISHLRNEDRSPTGKH